MTSRSRRRGDGPTVEQSARLAAASARSTVAWRTRAGWRSLFSLSSIYLSLSGASESSGHRGGGGAVALRARGAPTASSRAATRLPSRPSVPIPALASSFSSFCITASSTSPSLRRAGELTSAAGCSEALPGVAALSGEGWRGARGSCREARWRGSFSLSYGISSLSPPYNPPYNDNTE